MGHLFSLEREQKKGLVLKEDMPTFSSFKNKFKVNIGAVYKGDSVVKTFCCQSILQKSIRVILLPGESILKEA